MEPCGAVRSHIPTSGRHGVESKPSGAVDPSEPQQPLPALTELYPMEKQVGTMFSWVSEFPLAFFSV